MANNTPHSDKETVKRRGKPFAPGNNLAGSRKGVPNKVTAQLKDMILGALDDAGGQKYLARQAEENPGAFMALIGKVLPVTLQGGGENGEIIVKWEQ